MATSVRLSRLAAAVEGDARAVRMRLDRMGTAAFIGTIRGALTDSAGRTVATVASPLAVYYDMEPRLTAGLPGGRLAPGLYRLRVEIVSERQDLAPEVILPSRPVRDSMEVRLP